MSAVTIGEIVTGAIVTATDEIPLYACPKNRNREVRSVVMSYTGTVAGLTVQLKVSDGTNKFSVGPPVAPPASGQEFELSTPVPIRYGEVMQLLLVFAGATPTNTYEVHVLGQEETP